jgi:hypothetical protein
VRAGKLRFQAKVAGFMMMLFGAFFVLNFSLAAYSTANARTLYAQDPGGLLTVQTPEHPGANLTLLDMAGRTLQTATADGNGTAQVQAANSTFRLRVEAAGTAWERRVFLPHGANATVALHDADARTSEAWLGLDLESYRWTWFVPLLPLAITVAGWCAFKLRGPRLALGGAFLFVAGTALLAATFLGLGLAGLAFVGTAALCFVFVYRARAEFAPLRRTA